MLWLGAALGLSVAAIALAWRRLWLVVRVAHLDRPPPPALAALDPHAPPGSVEHELRQVLDEVPSFAEFDEVERDDAAAAALRELDFALARGARWPMTCARVLSSLGFLFAAAQLRAALLQDALSWEQTLPQLLLAVQVVATTFCGSLLCLALGREAQRLQRLERDRVHTWIERLVQPPAQPISVAAIALGR